MPDGPGGWGLHTSNSNYMPTASGPADWGNVLREFHVPWPACNQDAARQAADAWTALADGIDDITTDCNNQVASITGNNAGQAIDAFAKTWGTYGGKSGALPLSSGACRALAKACNDLADKVSDVKTQIEHKAEDLAAATVAAGVALIFSFGVSAFVDAGYAESVVTWATDLITDIAEFANTINATLSDSIGLLAGPVGAAAGASVAGFSGGAVAGTFAAMFDEEFENSLDALNKEPLPTPGEELAGVANSSITGGLIGILAEATPAFAGELTSDASAGQVFQASPQLAAMLSESSKYAAWLNSAAGKAFMEAGGAEALKKAGLLNETDVEGDLIETMLEGPLAKIYSGPKDPSAEE